MDNKHILRILLLSGCTPVLYLHAYVLFFTTDLVITIILFQIYQVYVIIVVLLLFLKEETSIFGSTKPPFETTKVSTLP